MRNALPRRRLAHTAFSTPVAICGLVGFFTSVACSTDATTGHKDGGDQGTNMASGGSSSGGSSSGGSSSGASASGGTTKGNSGGSAANGGAANGGAASGGAANGGAANGGTGGAGRTNSGGANSGGSTSSAGANNGGAATGGTPSTAGASNDSGAPMLIDHLVTFYGWPDNDPAGNGIAYPKLHQGASGTGTYADPITFATDPTEWKPGTILYVPYLKRYVLMEDSCAECIQDWKTRKYHIDLWLESNGSFDSQVLACENTLTRSKTSIEVNPPPDRPVDATPLFDTKSGKCNPPQ